MGASTTAITIVLMGRDVSASSALAGVSGAADRTSASLLKVSSAQDTFTKKMGSAGSALTKNVTAPILGLAAVSIDQAAKFQKSMATIAAVTDQTTSQMKATSAGVLTIANQTGTSTSQLADGLYTVEKSGLRGTAALISLRAAAQGAKIENVDLATMTNALTSVMASYASTMKNPVQATNELVKGSSLAKTTMAQYAGSLSTVLSIASAAGISFAQVGGAIATLTQHGVSADEATQELAFTIRNLQAPNNVTVQAMNQLGLSAVDISSKLGQRGLTGTFDLIRSKLPASGLVYIDTMKKMEAGQADLQAMLATMPADLQQASKAYLSGTLGMSDYRKEIRSLGADGHAQGSQFLTLADQVNGFSNAVKAGTPQQKTMVQVLKDMLGGANGLQTFLQTSGANATFLANAVQQIGEAGQSTSQDVAGFGAITQTTAFKTAQLKAELQTLAIQAGTTLLPFFDKLVGALGSAVTGFSHLTSTDQTVLLWSAGILAALGPVLSIGSKLITAGSAISTFASNAVLSLGTFGAGADGALLRISSAMKGITAAVGGAAVGFAIGTLTQNASQGVKALGILGSAAAGAAIGFGAGGGVGAAIGGVAGALSALISSWKSQSDAAQESSALTVAATNRIATALQGVYDLNSSIATQQASSILSTSPGVDSNGKAKASPLQIAQGVGISPTQVMQLVKSGGDPNTLIGQGTAAGNKLSNADWKTLYNSITTTQQALINVANANALAAEAQGKSLLSATQLGFGFGQLGTVLNGLNYDTEYGTEAMKENFAALTASTDAMTKNGASVATVNQYYDQQIALLQGTLNKLGIQPSAIQQVIATYAHMPTQITTLLTQRGVTPTDIQALVTKYGDIPQQLITTITQAGVTPSEIQAVTNSLLGIPPTVTSTVNVNTGQAMSAIAAVRNAVNTLSGAPLVLAVHGQNVAHNAYGSITRSYSVGGMENHVPQIASPRAGLVRVWAEPETQGEAYIPLANDGRRPRARAIAAETVRRLGGVAQFSYGGYSYSSSSPSDQVSSAISAIGQSASSQFTLSDQLTIGTVWQQITAAMAALSSATRQGLASATAASMRAQIASLQLQANQQLTNLRLKIRSSDLTVLQQALTATADQTTSAVTQLSSDLMAVGASTTAWEAQQISSMLSTAQTKLASIKDYASSITSTLTGAWDSTTAGSINDLVSGFGAATSTASLYGQELRKLQGEAAGNSTLLAYVNQLAAKGQTTTLQTLAGASMSDLARVTSALSAYNGAVQSGVDAATVGQYGATQSQESSYVSALAAAIAGLAAAVGSASAKPAVLDSGQLNESVDVQIAQWAQQLVAIAQRSPS